MLLKKITRLRNMALRKTKIIFALLFLVIYKFIRPTFQVERQIYFPEIHLSSFQYKCFTLKKNRRLIHATITSVQVYDDLACFQQCTRMKDSACRSVNFKKQPTNGLHLCEMLTNVWYDKTDFLEEDEEFDHMSMIIYPAASCAEIPAKISGVFSIFPIPFHPVHVFCDMVTNGGGWTVIQRRIDGSIDFFRDWTEYKRGFGNKLGEYWFGLNNIHTMTSQRIYRLRIELMDFDGNTTYAEYSSFSVSSEADNYRLTIGQYSGTAGDSLVWHNGMQFSTKDRVNSPYNCASLYKGAWWYGTCHQTNLNGQYLSGANTTYGVGINWKAWLGYKYSLKRVAMKIRPA